MSSVLYRVVFQQPPGGQPYRTEVYFDADSDRAALNHMTATWTRAEVLSLFAMPYGRDGGSQRRVWIRL